VSNMPVLLAVYRGLYNGVECAVKVGPLLGRGQLDLMTVACALP
jgi:hypothetical protein